MEDKKNDTTPHVATDKDKKTVKSMCAFGIPQLDIAAVIGITDKTLRKHYRHELDVATAEANAKIANVLYNKCIIDQDTASVIFWLKTRAKWSETTNLNHSGGVEITKIVDDITKPS